MEISWGLKTRVLELLVIECLSCSLFASVVFVICSVRLEPHGNFGLPSPTREAHGTPAHSSAVGATAPSRVVAATTPPALHHFAIVVVSFLTITAQYRSLFLINPIWH